MALRTLEGYHDSHVPVLIYERRSRGEKKFTPGGTVPKHPVVCPVLDSAAAPCVGGPLPSSVQRMVSMRASVTETTPPSTVINRKWREDLHPGASNSSMHLLEVSTGALLVMHVALSTASTRSAAEIDIEFELKSGSNSCYLISVQIQYRFQRPIGLML